LDCERHVCAQPLSRILDDHDDGRGDDHDRGTDDHDRGTDDHNRGTDDHNRGTDDHDRGTDDHDRGTDDHDRGTDDHDRGADHDVDVEHDHHHLPDGALAQVHDGGRHDGLRRGGLLDPRGRAVLGRDRQHDCLLGRFDEDQ